MSRLTVGCGAREVLARAGVGEVVAVYRRAAYLRLPGGIVALVMPGSPPGPLWITAAASEAWVVRGLWNPVPPEPSVTVVDGWLEVGGARLPVGRADTWRGELPNPAGMRAAVPLALDVLGDAPPSALLEEPWRAAWDMAEPAVRDGDLGAAALALGGLGPGLTPAGDDALAGILLARRALGGAGVEDELVARAGAARTTELSAALLAWAARGQAAAPVHDLLLALAGGDGPTARAAMGRVAALGASSGADLLLGLRLGLAPAG